MKIIVASKNEIKVNAVKELLSDYKFLSGAKVISVSALSGVSEQPLSLGEAIQGAKTRARNAFINCSYSFGIESGLMKVLESKTGYMDVCVCSIYDGREYHLGLSCAFESPPEITRLMAKEGMDMSQAYHL